ncbi:DUF424 family protein [archaeon]|nr:DUF424 family protein [archaeon]
MTYILKIHESDNKQLVALCDSELLGKVFEQNNFILDIDEDFFGGDIADEKTILESIKIAHTINASGNKIVEFLLSKNIIEKSHVKTIDNVKYVIILRI